MNNPETIRQIESFQPLPEQAEALDRLAEARQQGIDRGYLDMATGTGKTVVAAHDVSRFIDDDPTKRVLMLCHDSNILRQNHQTFSSVLESDSHGYFFGGQYQDKEQVVYATFQSMNRKLGSGKVYEAFNEQEFDYLVVDEGHHGPANTYKPVIEYFKPEFTLGLTATPDRRDQRDLRDIFGQPLYRLSLEEAMASGSLARPDYRLLSDRVNDLEGIKKQLGNNINLNKIVKNLFVEKREEEIISEIDRNITEVKDPRMVIFCPGIEYAEKMSGLLPASAATLHSKLSGDKQDERLAQFRSGELKTLLAVDKLNEGIDIPETNVVVFLRSTESRAVYLQQLGRGLRKIPGKEDVMVLDFAGSWDRIKMVQDLQDSVRSQYAKRQSSGLQVIDEPFEFNFSAETIDAIHAVENARKAISKKAARKLRGARKDLRDQAEVQLKDMLSLDELPAQSISDSKYEVARFNEELKGGLPQAREKLVLSSLRRAMMTARRLGDSGSITTEDHFQNIIEQIDLVAKKATDAEKPLKTSDLGWAVRKGVERPKRMDHNELIRLPARMSERINKINSSIRKFEFKYGRVPNTEDLAEFTGLSDEQIEEVKEIERNMLDVTLLDFDDYRDDEQFGEDTLLDDLLKKINAEKLNELINNGLDSIEETIFRHRYGFETSYGDCATPLTLDEVASIFRSSREYIRQIEKGALKSLAKEQDDPKAEAARQYFRSLPEGVGTTPLNKMPTTIEQRRKIAEDALFRLAGPDLEGQGLIEYGSRYHYNMELLKNREQVVKAGMKYLLQKHKWFGSGINLVNEKPVEIYKRMLTVLEQNGRVSNYAQSGGYKMGDLSYATFLDALDEAKPI